MPQGKKQYTSKGKKAVNQFFYFRTNDSPSGPKKDPDDNSPYDVEIVSTTYPKKKGMIIVQEQDKLSVDVELCLRNNTSDSIVFDTFIRNKEKVPINTITIQPGKCGYLTIKNIAFHGLDFVLTNLDFGFHIEKDGCEFTKSIMISAQLKNKDLEAIKPTAEYKPLPGTLIYKRNESTNVYPAPSIQKMHINNLPKAKLYQYEIPKDIRKIINHGLKNDGLLTEQDVLKIKETKEILESQLTKDNYKAFMELLLYMEEMQNEIEIGKFTIPKTPMYFLNEIPEGIYLELEISGLIDSNIKIHTCDEVSVKIIQDDGTLSKETYQGSIDEMKPSSIILLFGKMLASLYYDDMEFEVQFRPSRFCVRAQHRALNLVSSRNLWPVLFPKSENIDQMGKNPLKIQKFFDENIGKNPEQQVAVNSIVSGCSRPCPYIIYGPPGTGKTVTIVEAMKQVVCLFPESRVLACAVSNAAADILARKLLQHEPKLKILRMYAVSFNPKKIPLEIYLSSNFSEVDDAYFYPSLKELMTYNIIICTVMTAARLTAPEIQGHFTHVFIDEAGFCKESELVVAIAGTLDFSKTQLVLAGDPEQLGPVIQSPFAAEYKLNVSFMERIMKNNQAYQRQANGKFDEKVITKLLKNYRTHPDILKIVSDLFYHKELQACANMEKVSKFCNWGELPAPGFPIILHSIVGQETREGNCPSYFNVEEASIVVDYIKLLYKEGTKPEDIGVITPYCKQVQKINILLQRLKIRSIKVNSVEKFLGDEKTVIIISTVRSNPIDAKQDYQNCMLGFLKNKKRFNVAISRTKALLIVIGNIFSLCSDSNWYSLLRDCTERGAIKAESLSAREEAIKFISNHKQN